MINHKPISIADQVFEQLEHDILSGTYKKGDILNEVKLAESLSVSRTPIREAIRRLEQEHLLEDSSKGLTVVGISREDMLDMYEIRMRLEGFAAARAANLITDDILREMEETLEMQRFNIEKHSENDDRSERIKDADSNFHKLLHEAADSPVLYDVLEPIQMKITKYRKASVSKKSRAVESYNEHMRIYEALKGHDSAKAEEATIAHARNAKEFIADLEVE